MKNIYQNIDMLTNIVNVSMMDREEEKNLMLGSILNFKHKADTARLTGKMPPYNDQQLFVHIIDLNKRRITFSTSLGEKIIRVYSFTSLGELSFYHSFDIEHEATGLEILKLDISDGLKKILIDNMDIICKE